MEKRKLGSKRWGAGTIRQAGINECEQKAWNNDIEPLWQYCIHAKNDICIAPAWKLCRYVGFCLCSFCSGTYTLVHTAYLFLLLSSFPSAGWYTRKSESSLWKRHNDRKRMQFGACGRKALLSLLAWHDRQWSRRTSLRPGHLGQNRWCDCFRSNVCLAECCMFPKLFGKKQ